MAGRAAAPFVKTYGLKLRIRWTRRSFGAAEAAELGAAAAGHDPVLRTICNAPESSEPLMGFAPGSTRDRKLQLRALNWSRPHAPCTTYRPTGFVANVQSALTSRRPADVAFAGTLSRVPAGISPEPWSRTVCAQG